jgi:tetratricopeptide (TPR) repeat protein
MSVEIYGVENKYSRLHCERLGFCYARQGRYDDAIIHFQRTIEKVAFSNEGDLNSCSAYIEEIRAWIWDVEEMKEEARKEQPDSDTSALADIEMSSSQQ